MNYGVGYVRVSTDDQRNNGVSLDMQITKIRQYCALNDIELVGIYGDPGISGKRMDNRPGIQSVMCMLKAKRISHLVCYKTDRISRSTVDTILTIDAIAKLGAFFHSITEQFNTDSVVGRFTLTLVSALAQMEREQIAERTRDAMRAKANNGEKVSRFAPIGKRFSGNAVLSDAQESEAIAAATAMRSEGLSLKRIARNLARMGYRSRVGTTYSASTIAAMLRSGGAV